MDTLFQTEFQKGSLTLVCGRTGSGKTTFLKKLMAEWKERAGMVLQNPDNQIVCDKVRAELTYALANRGLPEEEIRGRVAETSSYFGISRMLDRDTDTLSGGEKQIVNLAAVMALNPDYLILDEPTSMLDPIMSLRLIEMILRIHRELGTTIVIAEHRPDELFDRMDRVIWLEKGEVYTKGTPNDVAKSLLQSASLSPLLPMSARLYGQVVSSEELRLSLSEGLPISENDPIPLSIPKGQQMLRKYAKAIFEWDARKNTKTTREATKEPSRKEVVLKLHDVLFAYEKHGRKLLEHMNMTLYKGEILSILGENGSGKTTLARLLTGQLKPYAGTAQNHARHTGMLFQDVTTHFTKDSYDGKHPYDYSGGEQQLLALRLIMEKKPELLILDEPTKGLDALEKEKLLKRLKDYAGQGMSIVCITHDVSWAAALSDRMALLFDGRLCLEAKPQEFIEKNMFYTTPRYRILGMEEI